MKKSSVITFLIFLLSWITAYGQSNLGIFVNPAMDFTNADIHHVNYAVGIKSDIDIYKGIKLKAALGYEHDYCDLSKMIHPDHTAPWLMDFTTHLIRTDLHLKYDFLPGNNVLSFYLFSGPSMNFSVYSKEHWEYTGLKEIRGCRAANLLISAGLGLGIKIGQTVSVNVEPTYATPLWKSKNVPTGIGNRYGLNIGLAYRFKNKNAGN